MQLSRWPITEDDAAYFQYDGTSPDDFIWNAIDSIGDRLTRRTDGSNLAPELLDPFVFAQFVAGLQGKYTVNGMPYAGNWRLMPCATRMAARLGATKLAEALREGEAELAEWDEATLDAFDSNRLDFNDPAERKTIDTLFERFDKRFEPLVAEGACSYGTSRLNYDGGEALLAALGDWITAEMPREILADQAAVTAKTRANHIWACDNVKNYEQEFTAYHVGHETYQMLQSLGMRFLRTGRSAPKPHEQPVIAREVLVEGGRRLLALSFQESRLLADGETFQELARSKVATPINRPDHLKPVLKLADAPRIAINPQTLEIHQGRLAGLIHKKLTYRH